MEFTELRKCTGLAKKATRTGPDVSSLAQEAPCSGPEKEVGGKAAFPTSTPGETSNENLVISIVLGADAYFGPAIRALFGSYKISIFSSPRPTRLDIW